MSLVVLATACTGSGKPGPSPSTSASSPRGGTLRVGRLYANIEFSDPQAFLGQTEILRLLTRTLLNYNGRSTAEGGSILRPDLATALPEVSPDGLTWTFHIKPGLRYAPPLQDTEITASDFVRSLERELTPSPPYLASSGGKVLGSLMGADYYLDVIQGAQAFADGMADTISGLEVPDPHTLSIHLLKPAGDSFAYHVGLTIPIPANPFNPGARLGVAQGHDGDYGYYLVASGPYMNEGAQAIDFSKPPIEQSIPVGFRPDSTTLVRNPSWDRATDGLRNASVDRVVVKPVDSDDQVAAVERGDLDVVMTDVHVQGDMPPGDLHRYESSPELQSRLHTAPSADDLLLFINVALAPFDDIHVRKAVSYALDMAAILQAFQAQRGEGGAIATHILPDNAEQNLLLNYRPYATDLKLAKAEMAQSKYDADHDGVCDAAACSAIRILAREIQPDRIAIAKIARKDLLPLGLRLRVDVEGGPEAFAYEDPASHVPLVLLETFPSYPSGSALLPDLLSSENDNISHVGASPAFLRKYGYPPTEVPNVDDRIKACQEVAFDAALRCWTELDQFVMEEVVPVIPLVNVTYATVVSARVRSLSIDLPGQQAGYQGGPVPALDQVVLTPAAASEPPPAEQSPSPVPTTFPAIPQGAYRVTLIRDDFNGKGIVDDEACGTTRQPTKSSTCLSDFVGELTTTLSNGHWRSTLVPEYSLRPIHTGVYYGTGDRVTFVVQTTPSDAVWVTMSWRLDGDRLVFRVLDASDPGALPFLRAEYETHPWQKVG